MDEMASEAQLSDEKAKKAMVDAARLADELRGEQDMAQAYEKDRKLYECQVKDMQQRLDEAETNALKVSTRYLQIFEYLYIIVKSNVGRQESHQQDGDQNQRAGV